MKTPEAQTNTRGWGRVLPRLTPLWLLLACVVVATLFAMPAFAEDPAPVADQITSLADVGLGDKAALADSPLGTGDGDQYPVNFVWTVVAAILVFWMQAGFALVEAGFTRAKNVVNIMMKNLMDFSLGSLAFFMIGFGLMFGATNGFLGTSHFFGNGLDKPWDYAFLFFQTVFAATAATIVSGAMAERTKFTGYLVYSVVISAFIYPIFGSWAWGGLYQGGGWLEGGDFLAGLGLGDKAFIDFAGSTVVHSVGGWAALAGAIVLGPRIGKYDKDGKPRVIRGHSMSLATLGVFILWMGWFGFNPGSTTAATGEGGKAMAIIAVNTNLAACAGSLISMLVCWKSSGKPDIGMTLNGALAGLVAITAPCANVSAFSSIIIGAIAGGLVVASVAFFDKIKVDDPVGAISVHGVCGAWGTLSAAIFDSAGFSAQQLGVQIVGILAAFVWTFSLAFLLFKTISATIGLRVAREDEIEGLDLSEHGAQGYPADVHHHDEPLPIAG